MRPATPVLAEVEVAPSPGNRRGRPLGDRHWPVWYLVDKHGTIPAVVAGETRVGYGRAKLMERTIEELLYE